MLAAPFSSRFSGLEAGPDALLGALGGDARRIPFATDAPVAESLADGLPRLAAAVAEEPRPVALLGECTLTPAVAGALRERHPDLALIWIDAHGDLNTPETSPSDFLGGMPFAALLGWCHPELAAAGGLATPLPETRAALVGARDLDPGERAAVEGSQLVVADDVAGALAGLPQDAPLYVHVDSDILDTETFPGQNFPSPDGWSAGRLRRELELVARTGRVVGVSVCCGNPELDETLGGFRELAGALTPLLEEQGQA